MPLTTPAPERHVAVLAFPFSSHAGILLRVLRRLAAAASDVAFSFYGTAKSNGALFSASAGSPPNIRPYDVPDGVPVGYVYSGIRHEDVNLFLEGAKEGFRRAMVAAEEEIGRRIGCVVADAFLWFSGELAEEWGVPWVPLRTGGPDSLAVHCHIDLIRDTVGIHGTEGRQDELLKFIPGISELRLGDLPEGVVFGDLEAPFVVMLYKMGKALPKATSVLINSFEELDPKLHEDLKAKFKSFLNIGPFNLTSPSPTTFNNKDEHGCLSWLDKQKSASVAYIGFGTVATPAPGELEELAGALEASGTPFLWSLKDSSRVHLPERFLERTNKQGKVVPWAPQVQVLSHASVGVFITHCGWNSVMESIAAGVPMVVRPFFGDQPLNTWMVEKVWRIGVRIEGGVFTKGGVMRALQLVLSQEQGKELKMQIGRYKELALKAAGPDGSSTRNLNTLLGILSGSN
ncbi:hypothetical protein NMG60_11012975 [Bertholletia excelsa]